MSGLCPGMVADLGINAIDIFFESPKPVKNRFKARKPVDNKFGNTTVNKQQY